MIVILGPGMTGPSADVRASLKKNKGVLFIGDGEFSVDYAAEIARLSERRKIGPDTLIYIHAQGSIVDGKHYLKMGHSGSPGGGIVESTNVLQALDNMTAYKGFRGTRATAWSGGVVVASSFSDQLLKDLANPDAPELKRTVAVNSAGPEVLDVDLVSNIKFLLKERTTLYQGVTKTLKGMRAWTPWSPVR